MELNFQYAQYSHDESQSKPIQNANEALTAFDQFDWDSEVEKANELQKCSPTLSFLFDSPQNMIWVSAVGEKGNLSYVSECRFPGEVRGFLGFGKKQGTVSLNTSNFSTQQARQAIELFIASEHTKLRDLYENS